MHRTTREASADWSNAQLFGRLVKCAARSSHLPLWLAALIFDYVLNPAPPPGWQIEAAKGFTFPACISSARPAIPTRDDPPALAPLAPKKGTDGAGALSLVEAAVTQHPEPKP